MRRVPALLVMLSCACLPPVARAQAADPRPAALTPERTLSQYVRTVWQRAEGLPQNSVYDVVQTRDGYLWAATQGGLVRFDGVRFTVFSTRTEPALRSDYVTTLLEDRNGVLWVGTGGSGLFSYRGGRLQPFAGGTPQAAFINELYEDADGALWVAMAGGLSRIAGGTTTTFTTADGLPSAAVRSVARDAQGVVWVATEGGLARFVSGTFAPLAELRLPSADARVIYPARDGTLWIGTARGLVRVRGGASVTLTTRDGLAGDFVRAVFEDAAGTLWIGTQDGGMSRIAGGRVDSVRAADGFPADDVRAFTADREGSLWIGTNIGGLVRLKEPKAVTYGQPEGLPHDIVLPVAADRAGTLWVGTYGGGVARVVDGRWMPLSTTDGLWNDVVLSLAPSARGGMWVGTRFGVNRIDGGRVTRIGRDAAPDAAVTALLEDRRGVLWIGTRGGVLRYDGTRAARPPQGSDPGPIPIVAIHEARDGAIWFGTEGGGAARLLNGSLTRFGTEQGLPNASVLTISEDEDGAVWIGTNGGVARYRDARLTPYRARDGLIDDTIYRIIDDARGSLWFSSNIGIQRITRDQFAAFDARQTPRLSGEQLGEADGMRSSECNGGVQPAGWRTADGVLWFPTIKGVVRIDPAALALTRRPPPVVFEALVADGLERPAGGEFSLEPGVRTLEFRYTALNLSSPDNVRFRYRLDGFDTDWIEGGSRRVAYYTNLPPATYTFRVSGANADGVWSEGVSAVVTLEPYFSQTPGFYLLAFATLFLVVFGLHRARVSGLQARERELARVAEERRWALEALQESEAQFRTLFENVNEGVYRSTPEGRIVLANRSMAQLLGYDAVDDLLRVPAGELYVNPEEYARLIALTRDSGEARAMEVRLRRRDGGQVTVLESTRLVRGQADQPAYFEGTLVDITDRKQLEEQLLQLQRIESIGRLAGSVAHDFNNLLTPILGQTDLIAADLPPADPRRARVDQIRKMALSARSLTRQLLAFSRRQILNRRVLDLNEAVGPLEDMLRRLIGEHIELHLRLAAGLASVRVDSGQLEQVLMNLAVNGRDAMPLGGTLTIETANATLDDHTAAQRPGVRPGKYVVLSVTDTGRGISPEVRDHLFEPFVTTKRHGTGLGLSTVYGIVTQSGGHITVESEPGRGAAFRVYLPALNEAVAESTAPSRPAADAQGRTILLVEDDTDVRDIAREALERAGYTVLAAEDAEDAQQVEEGFTGTIDLLLTDVVMPGLGGPALAARLLARRPGMKVLYTTGYIDDDVAHHGVLQPGVAVLEKPFTLEALRDAVQARLTVTIP